MSTLNCPGCGGLIQHISPHIRSIDCEYCGSWLRLGNGNWQLQSAQSVKLSAPAFLGIGKSGTTESGDSVRIVGRLRYRYGLGEWDEWWLEGSDGTGFWLEEDDGAYYRHTVQPVEIEHLNSASIAVGESIALGRGIELFVTEKYAARIVGHEGMLPVVAGAGEEIICVDGVYQGREYSLEILPGELSVSVSEEVDIESMGWTDAIH